MLIHILKLNGQKNLFYNKTPTAHLSSTGWAVGNDESVVWAFWSDRLVSSMLLWYFYHKPPSQKNHQGWWLLCWLDGPYWSASFTV